MSTSNPGVYFLTVTANEQKLRKIVEKALSHFLKKIPLLIRTPDQASLDFLDHLLWSTPPDGFLPHSIDQDDLVMLTRTPFQPKETNTLFNLCPDPVSLPSSYKTIYEFEDLTSPKKQEIFRQHFQFYRQAGCIIASETP